MKAKTLGAIIVSALLGLGTAEAKAEQMPFYETIAGQTQASDKWVIGGEKVGWNGGAGSNWTYTHNPINNNDGIEMRVFGPTNANSYGAEAWARTVQNFNDGNDWLINFAFQVDRKEPDGNRIFVQITDGYTDGAWMWFNKSIPGTVDLVSNKVLGFNGENTHLLALHGSATPWPDNIAHWSINIDKFGVARLYDGFDRQGNMISENQLDPNYPWYFRLMCDDVNSAGYGPGDMRLNVYSVDVNQIPEPGTTALLVGAGIAAAGYLGLRKKE